MFYSHSCRFSHWICSSSVGTDCGEVLLMDCLVSDSNKLVILQIAQIYIKFQQQNPTFLSIVFQFSSKKAVRTCGLFAIAFATEICTGHNPSDTEFVQSEMRPHLVNCLKMGKLSRFPQQVSAFHHPLQTKGFQCQGVLHVPYA